MFSCHGCIKITWSFVFILGVLVALFWAEVENSDEGSFGRHYTNGWAIKLDGANGLERAKRIAEKYGFEKVSQVLEGGTLTRCFKEMTEISTGQFYVTLRTENIFTQGDRIIPPHRVGTLEGYFHFEHPTHPSRSKRSAEDKTDRLKQDSEVLWAQQLHEFKRVKRGVHHNRVVTRGIEPRFADPLWDEQWYLDDKRNMMDLDVNVIPVWIAGISGKGVVVTILDDGVEHNHTDLQRNYDPAASWDINDNDPDPFPRYDPTNENKHGTRCAGEVAAEANNSKCGVGVAYNAKIGGVRMLDGRVTDRVEAESLSLNPQYIDIYSASWGPSDDGMTVEGPGTLASAAFLNGITKGRGGLGSIYVWASGNGGRHDDSCNCDGYTASIYTLSISSSSDHGESPWYSEACSSTLATTLSSGAHGEKRIVTTDLHDQCTERHTGTSASAPLAAGIIALALEKNPRLTWRDVQHVVVHTSNWSPLKRDPDWRMNGIGLHVNEKFGFGLLDAEKMVAFVDPKEFRTVPESKECKGKVFSDAKSVRWDQPLTIDIESDGCAGSKDEIRYLEHVQLVLTIEYPRRGDLTIFITSPMGTKSCLLPVRSEDSSDEGFKKWAFMTTHAWGEDPRGKWTLEIKDGGDSRSNQGVLRDWQLISHGTKEKPHHQNISHPEVPIHRKAVSDDDTQKNPESSVQITQITYTFGQPQADQAAERNLMAKQTALQQSFIPVSGYQNINPFTAMQRGQNSPASILGAYNLYQRTSNPFSDPTSINYANFFPQMGLPSMTPVASYFPLQNVVQPQTDTATVVGRSISPWNGLHHRNMQLYSGASPMWGIIKPMNEKRGSAWERARQLERLRKNSLIETLRRLQNLRR